MRNRAALAFSLAIISSSAFAGESIVLAVGKPAPVLELSAADGTPRSLAAVGSSTVLIFYRGLW